MADTNKDILKQLSDDISKDVGNILNDELETVSASFNKTLSDALRAFNSTTFDNDGFIKKMRGLDLGDSKDKDLIKNVLNNLRTEYIDVQSLNHSEILLRRDMFNVCTQMPEMKDVIGVVRDAIIECNVATGQVSRSLTFENQQDDESNEAQVKEIEERHDLLMAIKNFMIPRTLMVGEQYVHIVPHAKLFAELEAVKDMKKGFGPPGALRGFRESVPTEIMESFQTPKSLFSENNLKVMMESVSTPTKVDSSDTYRMEKETHGHFNHTNVSKEYMSLLLNNINVCNGSSVLMEELGVDGFRDFIIKEYKENNREASGTTGFGKIDKFFETMKRDSRSILGKIPEEDIDIKSYQHIKGCYVKYLDALRMIPVRIDRKIIGYYYISTTMDLQVNPAQPNGIVDLSFQHYTRDKNLVDNLAGLIIRSFDKKWLEKNIQLKTEIAEIIMAHRFSEGRLSFIFIPENEVIRLVINEDENGRGHSIIEPSLFPARQYLMLTLYNLMFVLNNNLVRIHYLKSSGLNKDYAAQIQRAIRKFQSRRITIDDIYSYSGVLNKVGGMGEMILPSGRGDYKALETESIEPVQYAINVEFLEMLRRQSLAGTGVPHAMIFNSIDEVDFAKQMELANTRFLSTVGSYKIDFNRGLTKMYQMILKYSTEMKDEVIHSFRFQFNAIKQKTLDVTNEMINNFNTLVEMVSSAYFLKEELEDKDQKPTPKMMRLKRELLKDYLPQLNFDELEEVIKKVNIDSTDDELQKRVATIEIKKDEVEEVSSET